MALGIDGVRVGTWSDPDVPTGCTVVLPPEGTVGGIAVRGAAPGTREAAALSPAGKVVVCHAVVLSGGSAYGLATADGVMRWLEEHDIGYQIPGAIVPIVGAAIVLDRAVMHPGSRPDAEAGRAACEAATEDDPAEGTVGAGTGCTVAKVGGLDHCWRGGQGIATAVHDDLVVSAIVANNGVGEVLADDGTTLVATRADPTEVRYPYRDLPIPDEGPTANTVIGCIVTNARLDKAATCRTADLGHSGIVRAMRPAHTHLDGDALFCLATGEVDAPIDRVTTMAADAVAEACRRGPLAAISGNGLPGKADAAAQG